MVKGNQEIEGINFYLLFLTQNLKWKKINNIYTLYTHETPRRKVTSFYVLFYFKFSFFLITGSLLPWDVDEKCFKKERYTHTSMHIPQSCCQRHLLCICLSFDWVVAAITSGLVSLDSASFKKPNDPSRPWQNSIGQCYFDVSTHEYCIAFISSLLLRFFCFVEPFFIIIFPRSFLSPYAQHRSCCTVNNVHNKQGRRI